MGIIFTGSTVISGQASLGPSTVINNLAGGSPTPYETFIPNQVLTGTGYTIDGGFTTNGTSAYATATCFTSNNSNAFAQKFSSSYFLSAASNYSISGWFRVNDMASHARYRVHFDPITGVPLINPATQQPVNTISKVRSKRTALMIVSANPLNLISESNKTFASIGCLAPYYNVSTAPSYKSVFSPISFSFAWTRNGKTYGVMTDFTYNLGQWYHIGVTGSSTSMTLYVNGVAVPTFQSGRHAHSFTRKFKLTPTASYRLWQRRLDRLPLAPGFKKRNGSIATLTPTTHTVNFHPLPVTLPNQLTYVTVGAMPGRQERKAYDAKYGKIEFYNSILSTSDMLTRYNADATIYV